MIYTTTSKVPVAGTITEFSWTSHWRRSLTFYVVLYKMMKFILQWRYTNHIQCNLLQTNYYFSTHQRQLSLLLECSHPSPRNMLCGLFLSLVPAKRKQVSSLPMSSKQFLWHVISNSCEIKQYCIAYCLYCIWWWGKAWKCPCYPGNIIQAVHWFPHLWAPSTTWIS